MPAKGRPPSRQGKGQIGGHFHTEVIRRFRVIAAEKGLTVQSLLAVAINDLFEKHGHPRIADQQRLPRGGVRDEVAE
ncbi:ribbon-helix-helix domain-containing protein [Methylobacterium sp. 174MFSha1.1]|uniref:ribbon-helix-helix domain-containing protein n=1 Tax=Methylobacterium sp. 174MFSha1.1 TaxID=1502749 RepID=UPI0032997335